MALSQFQLIGSAAVAAGSLAGFICAAALLKSKERPLGLAGRSLCPVEGKAGTSSLIVGAGKVATGLSLRGRTLELLSGLEREKLKNTRAQVLEDALKLGVCRLVAVKRARPLVYQPRQDDTAAGELDRRWMAQFASSFAVQRYLTISAKGNAKTVEEGTQRIADQLQSDGARLLDAEELGEVLGSIWDPVASPVKSTDPDDFAGLDLERDSRSCLRVWRGEESKVLSFVSVMSWGTDDSGGLLDEILALPYEMTVQLVMQGMSKIKSKIALDRHKKSLTGEEDSSILRRQFDELRDRIVAGEAATVVGHLYVAVHGVSVEQCKEATAAIYSLMADRGHKPRTETLGLVALYHGLMPGADGLVRGRMLEILNCASLFELRRDDPGFKRNDFGSGPLRYFRNAQGAAYGLNIHETEARKAKGNFLMFAPAGSGKTVLLQQLALSASRYPDIQVAVFDRLLGMRVMAHALGCPYIDPVAGRLGFNIFDCEDTPAERAFITSWLQMVSGCDAPHHFDEASRAVEMAFDLPRDQRRLAAIKDAFPVDSELRAGLSQWFDLSTQRGRLFNAPKCELRMERAGITFFDLTNCLQDQALTAGFVRYVMHKMLQRSQALGSPHLILWDEPLQAFANPVVEREIAKVYAEHRKARGAIGLVFQSIRQFIKLETAQILKEQSAGQFLFRNNGADAEDLDWMDVTEPERAFIWGEDTGTRRMRFPFLWKSGGKVSQVLESDLSPLGAMWRLFESGAEAWNAAFEASQRWPRWWERDWS